MPWFVEAKEKASRLAMLASWAELGADSLIQSADSLFGECAEVEKERYWPNQFIVPRMNRKIISFHSTSQYWVMHEGETAAFLIVFHRSTHLLTGQSSPIHSATGKFSKVCRDFGARLNPTNLHVPPQSGKGSLQECLHFGLQTWIGTQLASKSPSQKAGPKALKHVFIDFSDMHSPRNQRLKSVKGSKIYSKRFGFCCRTTDECSGSYVWTPRTVLCFCSHPTIWLFSEACRGRINAAGTLIFSRFKTT